MAASSPIDRPGPPDHDCVAALSCDANALFRYHDHEQIGFLLRRALGDSGRGVLAVNVVPEHESLRAKLEQVGVVGLTPADVRPSQLAMCDRSNPAGALLQRIGRTVEGEIDVACQAGGVYRPQDLLQLPSSHQERLRQLVANLWFWRCVEQWGNANQNEFPGVVRALHDLEQLRRGEQVFGPVTHRKRAKPTKRRHL